MNRFSALSRAFGIICLLAIGVGIVSASQDNLYSPTTGTVSGLQLTNTYNNALKALASCNSGASAPANLEAGEVAGQCWLDTSTTPYRIRMNDGASNWPIVGYLDGTNHIVFSQVAGGTATVASATTTDLWSVPQNSITISGTTTITALANSSATAGTIKIVKFEAILTLTHNSTSLVLPSGADITTAAGDYALVMALTSTNVAIVQYSRANGQAVSNPAVPVGSGPIPYAGFSAPTGYVFGSGQAISRASFPAYLDAVTSTQSVTRSSGSPTLTGFSDTTMFGRGMPIEGTGIPGSTTILFCSGTTCTMSGNASTSGTSDVTVFGTGYGSGGSTSTVGVPSCNGRTVVFRDNSGGTAANVAQVTSTLTTTASSTSATVGSATGLARGMTIVNANVVAGTTISDISGTTVTLSQAASASGTTVTARFSYLGDAQALASTGGSPTHTQVAGELASHTHGVTDPGHTHGPGGGGSFQTNNGGAQFASGSSQNYNFTATTTSSTTGVTINASTGGGSPMIVAPPSIVANCLYRVLP